MTSYSTPTPENRPLPPPIPARDRSKRPGFAGWPKRGRSSDNNTKKTTHSGIASHSQGTVNSEVSNASGLSTGTSSAKNDSVFWDGQRHPKGSVTAIVTNTLRHAEERLNRSLLMEESERSKPKFGREDSELLMSDAHLDVALGDLQDELNAADQAYRSSVENINLEDDTNFVFDTLRTKDDRETCSGPETKSSDQCIPVLTKPSTEFSSRPRLQSRDSTTPPTAPEPDVEAPVINEGSPLIARSNMHIDQQEQRKMSPLSRGLVIGFGTAACASAVATVWVADETMLTGFWLGVVFCILAALVVVTMARIKRGQRQTMMQAPLMEHDK